MKITYFKKYFLTNKFKQTQVGRQKERKVDFNFQKK